MREWLFRAVADRASVFVAHIVDGQSPSCLANRVYHHCIFCSASLGANQMVEQFPVGRLLAYDPARGRLWAVCPSCSRWNLAPIEERWEPVETAERLFRASPLRMHSENIGLARLPDGTRLVRVGKALDGELAVWRYGGQLARRRRKHVAVTAAGVISTASAYLPLTGLPLAAILPVFVPLAPLAIWYAFRRAWLQTEPVVDVLPGLHPRTGGTFTVHVAHLSAARITLEPDGAGLQLRISDRGIQRAFTHLRGYETGETLVLPDALARRVLRRGLVHLNRPGSSDQRVQSAAVRVADGGGAEGYLHSLARRDTPLAALAQGETGAFRQSAEGSLALEMALHEEEERRALQGELALLESAWREAEEIARIADALPGPPPE